MIHGFADKLLRMVFFDVFTHPLRLKLALLPARLLQKTGIYGLLRRTGLFDLLPAEFRKMEQMLPPDGPVWPEPLPFVTRPAGDGRRIVVCDRMPQAGHANGRPPAARLQRPARPGRSPIAADRDPHPDPDAATALSSRH